MTARVAAPPLMEGSLWRRLFASGVKRGSGPWPLRMLRGAAWAGFVSLLVVQHPATRRRRLRALITFWRCQWWRIRSRSYEVDLGPEGRLICPPWSALGPVTAAAGDHEWWEQRLARAVAAPGELVIDAGANLGFYAIPLARRGATVAAFEPAPGTHAALEENVAHNGLGNVVHTFRMALSDFDGDASFTTDLDARNHLVDGVSDDDATVTVPVRTLDRVAAEHPEVFGCRRLGFLKIDVEGQDEALLHGAKQLVAEHRPVILLETRAGAPDGRTWLENQGYRLFWCDWSERELVSVPAGWTGHEGMQTNVVAVPVERVERVEACIVHSVDAAPVPRVGPLAAMDSRTGPAG